MLEGSVKKVRAAARRNSLDAADTELRRQSNPPSDSRSSSSSLGGASEAAVLRPGVVAFLDAHGVGPGGMTSAGGMPEVDPVVLLVCRPSVGQDVMGGLLELENEVRVCERERDGRGGH
jgi:hypothetical protein